MLSAEFDGIVAASLREAADAGDKGGTGKSVGVRLFKVLDQEQKVGAGELPHPGAVWTPLLPNPADLGSAKLPEKSADSHFP